MDEENAAIKIQSHYRAFMERKKLKKKDNVVEDIKRVYQEPNLQNENSSNKIKGLQTTTSPNIYSANNSSKLNMSNKIANKIGIHLARNNTTRLYYISSVISDSIADKNGLLVGDIIIQINEVEMIQFTRKQIYEMLNSCLGHEIIFEVLREIDDNGEKKIKDFTIEIETEEENPGTKRSRIDNYKLMKNISEYAYVKRTTHWMAAKYFEKSNMSFVVPSILITTFSGIISFLASSSYFDNNATTIMTLVVGGLASISTLIQSFSSAFGFANKAEAHQNAVESYDQLVTKIRFKTINSGPEIDEKFIEELEEQISDIKQRCKYLIPHWIEGDFVRNKYQQDVRDMIYKTKENIIKIKNEKYLKKVKYLSESFDKLYRQKRNKEVNEPLNKKELEKYYDLEAQQFDYLLGKMNPEEVNKDFRENGYKKCCCF